jgi:hypothetical protein
MLGAKSVFVDFDLRVQQGRGGRDFVSSKCPVRCLRLLVGIAVCIDVRIIALIDDGAQLLDALDAALKEISSDVLFWAGRIRHNRDL